MSRLFYYLHFKRMRTDQRFEPSAARQRCFSNDPQGEHEMRVILSRRPILDKRAYSLSRLFYYLHFKRMRTDQRFEPSAARQRCFSNDPQGEHEMRVILSRRPILDKRAYSLSRLFYYLHFKRMRTNQRFEPILIILIIFLKKS